MTYFALLGRLLVLEVSVLHSCGEAQGEAIDDCPDFKFPFTDSGNLCITALTNLILPRLPYVRRNLATPTILSLKPLPLFPFRPCTKSSILIYQGSLRRTFRGKRTCNGSHNCDDCVICVTCLFLESICGSVRSRFPIAHTVGRRYRVSPQKRCLRERLALPFFTFLPVAFPPPEYWIYK